jgi:hypothetical protein
VTRLQAGQLKDQGSIPSRAGKFSFLHGIQTNSGPQPTSYAAGTNGFVLTVKWLGHEAHHSLLPTADTKNGGTVSPLPHIWCVIKHRDSFPFTISLGLGEDTWYVNH